jgi:hypothetical protein
VRTDSYIHTEHTQRIAEVCGTNERNVA